MITFDVKELARNVLIKDQPSSVKEYFITEMLHAAVEIFNDPACQMRALDDLDEVLYKEYGFFHAPEHVRDFLAAIRAKVKAYQWDPLIKAKVEFKTIGKGYYQARVVMDMQETVARMMNDCGLDRPAETHVTDIVCDNPGVELINELHPLRNDKARGKVPRLSLIAPSAVRSTENGGWGPGRWDRYGDAARLPLQLRGPERSTEDD